MADGEPPWSTSVTVPVDWTEGAPRAGFNYEYASIGSLPGVLADRISGEDALKRLLSHTVLLSTKDREQGGATDHARLTSGLLAKLLQRGYAPLPTLDIERAALKHYGLIAAAKDLAEDEVEIGWRLSPEKTKRDCVGEVAAELYALARVSGRAGELGAPLTMALLDLGETEPEFTFCSDIARALARGQPDSQWVLNVYELRKGAHIARAATETTVRRWEECKDELERRLAKQT